jgi:SAM-dependent methyltransferase
MRERMNRIWYHGSFVSAAISVSTGSRLPTRLLMPTNVYSPEWFSFFLYPISSEQTAREVQFVDQQLEPGSCVLDLPCGSGRHARLLATQGHRVIAIDRESTLLGPSGDTSVAWICADMRALPLPLGRLDAIVCLWQSFGYFDAEENATLLQRWAALVRPGGRLMLDLYHRSFFEANQGERRIEHGGDQIRETKIMHGDRLVVELAYENHGGGDRFEWQLFTPEELTELASRCGWELHLSCTGFDPKQAPDSRQPRVQYVLSRSIA